MGEPFVGTGVGGELCGTGLGDVWVSFADHGGCGVGMGAADKAVTRAMKARGGGREVAWRDVV